MKYIAVLILAALASFYAGCSVLKSQQAPAVLYYAGFKVAAKAQPSEVEFVADAIGYLLNSDAESIAYSAVESWYAEYRLTLKLDPIDREMLEMLVIKPLWDELKKKYGGVEADLTDPQVRASLAAFQSGLLAGI